MTTEDEKNKKPADAPAVDPKNSSADSAPQAESKKEAPVKTAIQEPETSEKASAEKKPSAESQPEKTPVAVPAKFKKLVDEISRLSVLELSELVKVLEEKFGVTAMTAAPAPVAAAGGGGGADEEPSVYNVELAEAGSQKIQVIKAVRELTGKGLKESKDVVDKAPITIKEGASKEEAEEIKKKLEEAGAVVNLK